MNLASNTDKETEFITVVVYRQHLQLSPSEIWGVHSFILDKGEQWKRKGMSRASSEMLSTKVSRGGIQGRCITQKM